MVTIQHASLVLSGSDVGWVESYKRHARGVTGLVGLRGLNPINILELEIVTARGILTTLDLHEL